MTGNGTGSRSGRRTGTTTCGLGRNTSESRGPGNFEIFLECPADCEFEVVRRLMNGERSAGNWPEERLIDPCRVKCEIHAERRIQDGHHDLKLNSGTHA